MANNYITNKIIGVDDITDLNIELRVKEVLIDAHKQKITIKVEKYLVSPTGVEMKLIESLYYERYNDSINNNMKYDQLDASPIGQGIKQILLLDLNNYPNLLQ
jgi:hypothetical protein